MMQDLRYALRTLLRSPVFTLVAVLTLALGIGTNTALFSVIDGVLVRPLPYDRAGRLVTLWETEPQRGADLGPVSPPDYLDVKARSRTLEDVAAYRFWGFVLTGGGEPERIVGAKVSASLFRLLAVRFTAGRPFSADEDRYGGRPVVVVSDALWRRRFGADPALVGRTLTLSGGSYEVVGVLAPEARLPDADVWAPLAFEPYAFNQRGARALTVLARRASGVGLDQTRAELRAIAGRIRASAPELSAGWDIAVVPLKERLVAGVRPTLLLLWVAVGLVLLIACANLANLLVARATDREQEIALRTALGATRARLIRQLVTESAVAALLGGALGAVFAAACIGALVRLDPSDLPRAAEIAIDARVLAFTLVLSLATGLGFGLVPAWRASTPDLGQSLKEGKGRATAGRRLATFRGAAVASEIALALVLLVGAGLLARSFARLQSVDPGFRPAHVLTLTLSLPDARYGQGEQRATFFGQLLAQAGALPGVTAVGLASHLPLAGRGLSADVAPEGRAPEPGAPRTAEYVSVTPGYFRVMGIPLIAGRQISDRDAAQAPPVVVINQVMARRLWPGTNPIGQRVVVGSTLGADPRPREVVGVVGDVRAVGLESDPAPAVYVPYGQNPWPTMSMVIHGGGEPMRLAAAAQREVRALDPDLPVYNLRPLEDVLGKSLAARRVQMLLLLAFAGAALSLAAIGVYGVVAQAVGQRTHEVGIRMALGAERGDVLRLVVGQGMRPVACGVLAGAVAAAGTSRLLRGLLFGVGPADPETFAAAAVFLALVALIACWLPARRATRVDPVEALRAE